MGDTKISDPWGFGKPQGSGLTPIVTPDWVKDAIFYQIFPDRFARSERVPKPSNLEPWDSPPTVFGFKGGDLLGVAERLDYVQELGITAIYFNPIFQSAANHRYHTHDYYRVDPILGGNETFRELLDAAHARGMRVVLDGVFNHASRGFYPFHDTMENGVASPYLDWFYFDEERLQAGERLDTTQRPGGFTLQPLSAVQFADAADHMLTLYDWEVTLVQLNLLSSHDMPWFLTLVQGDKEALKLATLFQMTSPGVPCVYDGDEIGMEGRHDPDCRRAFPWDEARWDHDLLAFCQRAISLRHEHPALRRGRYFHLHTDDRHGVYAFVRQGEEETLVVVLNNYPTGYDLYVPVRGLFADGTALHDL